MGRSRAVLVTGCSSGIGRATALALVRAGLPTWASARDPASLADLEDAGCRTLRLDVTDEESRLRAVEAVQAEHGAVAALVNNAGYAQVGAVEEVPLEALRRQFETNVFGLVRLCQLVLPGMREQHYGTIVNVGSAAGLVTPPASSAYAMTKYALESLSDALRLETRAFGVRVALLEPGAVRTRFTSTLAAGAPRRDLPGPYDTLIRNALALAQREGAEGRGLAPEHIAEAVVHAVTSRRPRTRYRIGAQARLGPPARRAMGDRLWDQVLGRVCPSQ
ncbi:SDR family NAD(P)-dependent oxidoreductase [Streptacidiphilus carbonis]|uniref:SDR family NAD(P)-dependent oxidoreductase n=1 Tax=Streptacidiphilus carbonis TaxID=105422 RepID=UPI0005A85115|nr:SDR family NAD(P)-dependent oxidoreductase [Streptacidiphilus carbonis]